MPLNSINWVVFQINSVCFIRGKNCIFHIIYKNYGLPRNMAYIYHGPPSRAPCLKSSGTANPFRFTNSKDHAPSWSQPTATFKLERLQIRNILRLKSTSRQHQNSFQHSKIFLQVIRIKLKFSKTKRRRTSHFTEQNIHRVISHYR
jgi:hypothetical protein